MGTGESMGGFGWLKRLLGVGRAEAPPPEEEDRQAPDHDNRRYNLLVVSDLHLGEATKDRSRISYLKAAVVEDMEFCRFLEYHQVHRVDDLPWCLVLAGDVFDFLAISVSPDPQWALERYGFTISERERRLGMENSAPKIRWKLDRILDRHPAIITYLADFVGSGNRVIFLRGNHDAELFWPEVKQTLVQRLLDTYFGGEQVEGITPDEFTSRIEFRDWFVHVPGAIHIQHGHQYDEYCSMSYLLNPLRPGRPDLLELAPTSILIRYGMSRVAGVKTHDKDEYTFVDFVRWLFDQPISREFQLVSVYFRVLREQFRYWRSVKGADDSMAREGHQENMKAEAARSGLPLATLQAMDSLSAKPSNLDFWSIVVSMFFDSVATFLLTPVILAAWLALSPLPWWATGLVGVGILGFAGLLLHLFNLRRDTDLTPKLRVAARKLAPLVRTPYLVMGHTHRAEAVDLGNGVTYLNTGCWLNPEGEVQPHGITCDCPTTFVSATNIEGTGPMRVSLHRWCLQEHRPEAFGHRLSGSQEPLEVPKPQTPEVPKPQTPSPEFPDQAQPTEHGAGGQEDRG